MDPAQRQQKIRALIATASVDQLRAALESVLSETASAQREPDLSDYGIGQWRSSEVVDAEVAARSGVADDVDASVLAALELAPGTGA